MSGWCFAFLVFVLACVSIIDCKIMRIPDELNIALAGLGIAGKHSIISALEAASILFISLLCMFFLLRLLKKNWLLGGGDIKMLGAGTLCLEPSYIPVFLILTGIAGIFSGLLSKSRVFPFAPAISIGLLLTLSIMDIKGDFAPFAAAHAAVQNGQPKKYQLKKGVSVSGNNQLECIYIKAKSQPAKRIIILMHGYGADAEDMTPIAQAMGDAIDDADIFVPDGFDLCDENPTGRQWFDLRGMGKSEEWRLGIDASAKKLNEKIDMLLKQYKLDDSRLCLAGFSQGAMMALHVGLQRGVSGIVGFSGMLVNDSVLKKRRNKTFVLLIHGDRDMVVPMSCCVQAENSLKSADISVKTIIMSDVGHAISSTAIRAACDFIKQLK
jgi:phospholipase/carboxylesterase